MLTMAKSEWRRSKTHDLCLKHANIEKNARSPKFEGTTELRIIIIIRIMLRTNSQEFEMHPKKIVTSARIEYLPPGGYPQPCILLFCSYCFALEFILLAVEFRAIRVPAPQSYTAHGNILSNCNGLEPVMPGTFKLSPYASTCLHVIARAIARSNPALP